MICHRAKQTNNLFIRLTGFCLLACLALFAEQHQQHATNQGVEAKPIVNGYLNPWEVPFRHSSGFLREPMPWEDGYFDPSYHAWPKSRQQQVGSKQALKIASDSTMSGGAGKIKELKEI